MLGALARALVVRTSVVYGPERQGKNSVYQLIRACRSGKGFRPAVDQRASPSYNPDVAAATVECASGSSAAPGTWPAPTCSTAWPTRSWSAASSTWTPPASPPATTAQLGQKAARPLNGGLRIDKAQAQLRTPLRGVEAGLRAMRAAHRGGAGVRRLSGR